MICTLMISGKWSDPGGKCPSSQGVTKHYTQVKLVAKSSEFSETKHCYFYFGPNGRLTDAERYGGVGLARLRKKRTEQISLVVT